MVSGSIWQTPIGGSIEPLSRSDESDGLASGSARRQLALARRVAAFGLRFRVRGFHFNLGPGRPPKPIPSIRHHAKPSRKMTAREADLAHTIAPTRIGPHLIPVMRVGRFRVEKGTIVIVSEHERLRWSQASRLAWKDRRLPRPERCQP